MEVAPEELECFRFGGFIGKIGGSIGKIGGGIFGGGLIGKIGGGNIGGVLGKILIDPTFLIGQAITIRGLPNASTVIKNGGSDIRCNLATSYGSLNKESFKTMDKELKIIIGYTVGSLGKLGKDLTWDNVIRCMNGNVLLKPKPGTSIHRTDGITKRWAGAFRTDGSPSHGIIQEVNAFFNRLVSDSDVVSDTGIDINTLGRIVASSGAGINSVGAIVYRKVRYSKEVMDVSVLRFPDIDRPFFKVYRIRLRAWRRCERFLFYQRDKSGISGEYNSICYSPKPEVVAKLNSKVIDAAIKEAEDLFD